MEIGESIMILGLAVALVAFGWRMSRKIGDDMKPKLEWKYLRSGKKRFIIKNVPSDVLARLRNDSDLKIKDLGDNTIEVARMRGRGKYENSNSS